MHRDHWPGETEALATYIETVTSSMESVLTVLATRHGRDDRRVVLAREAVEKCRELQMHLGRLPAGMELLPDAAAAPEVIARSA